MALPIWELHQEILARLQTGNRLVLVAPTGSGKTTQVPQMILDAGLADQPQPRRVVVLQPRRVAARTVAARVCWERKTPLGGEVGYQIRFDDQTSLGTRICYVTEGILLRWMQEDPRLPGVAALIFDEFHERNLYSDVALALAKKLQEESRPDLRLVVMSATLDAEPVARYLGAGGDSSLPCPILVSEGRSFPVETRYLSYKDERPVPEQAADAVEHILQSGAEGDILIFMPGMAEIQSTLGALRAVRGLERFTAMPLHGDLPPEEQDRAFQPNPLRKVIVATNVAETSVTIEGIRLVVDSGLARIARYNPERGISSLLLEPISRASADQRQGRAGRTAPGVCYRLWTESGHLNRPERNTPEIQRSDLAEVVLLLHSLHVRAVAQFDWLDAPERSAVERAEALLKTLGALDHKTGELTSEGRQMLRLPMHPRYSRLLVEAARHRCVPAASLCAALVSGRDLLMKPSREQAEARELFEASTASDFYTLMRAYQFARKNHFQVDSCRRYGIHARIARDVEQTYEQILHAAKMAGLLRANEPETEARPESDIANAPPPTSDDALLRCLMAGFIDQLCARRDQGTLNCELTEGRTGTLMRESVVQHSPLFVAADIREVASRGSGNLTLLGLASAVQKEWIIEVFPEQVTSRLEYLYDRAHKRVAAVRLVRFRDLVIDHKHLPPDEMDSEASGRALAQAYLKGWFELPLLNHELKQFIARINLVAAALPELELPAFHRAGFEQCLGRAFAGLTLAKEAQAAPLREAILGYLPAGQRNWIEELAPRSIPWTEDRTLKLLYQDQELDEPVQVLPPEAQVKLHECFGLKLHPTVCEGRVPVRLWLSAPDGKRLESTQDWPAFKTQSYPKLRAGLRQKYPGVAWI